MMYDALIKQQKGAYKMASKFKPYFDRYCKPESSNFEKDFRTAVYVWLMIELDVNRTPPSILSEMIDREIMFYPIITNEHGTTYIKHALIKALNELRNMWHSESELVLTIDLARV